MQIGENVWISVNLGVSASVPSPTPASLKGAIPLPLGKLLIYDQFLVTTQLYSVKL